MSYEVYIDVRHHPRHLEDWEQRLSTASKYAEPSSSAPSEADRLRTVVAALRSFADKLDPDWHCTHCGKARGEHFSPSALPRCFGRYGPITQWAWWQESAASKPADACEAERSMSETQARSADTKSSSSS